MRAHPLCLIFKVIVRALSKCEWFCRGKDGESVGQNQGLKHVNQIKDMVTIAESNALIYFINVMSNIRTDRPSNIRKAQNDLRTLVPLLCPVKDPWAKWPVLRDFRHFLHFRKAL